MIFQWKSWLKRELAPYSSLMDWGIFLDWKSTILEDIRKDKKGKEVSCQASSHLEQGGTWKKAW